MEACGFVFSQSTLIWISLGFSFLYGINYSKKRIFLPGCPATDSFFHWSTTFRSCSRPPRTQAWRHVGRSRFKAGSEDLRSSRVALRTLFIFAKCCRTWHEPPWKKKRKRIHATVESWKTSPWKKINFYLKKNMSRESSYFDVSLNSWQYWILIEQHCRKARSGSIKTGRISY